MTVSPRVRHFASEALVLALFGLLVATAQSVHRPVFQDTLKAARPFSSLKAGKPIEGSIQFGLDVTHPRVVFTADDGRRFEKSCNDTAAQACFTIAVQALFAHNQQVDSIGGVTLQITDLENQQTWYSLARGQEPFLSFAESPGRD